MPDKVHETVNLPRPSAPSNVLLTPKAELDDEEELARQAVARLSLTNEELLKTAAKNPPQPDYFEGEEEMPLDPSEEELAKEELKRIMPSKDRLRKIAAKCGPLPKWLDEDEPCPF